MNGSVNKVYPLCGLCKASIGQGKGLRTGIQILNFRCVLTPTDPKLIHLSNLPVKATINLCLHCLESMTENLVRKDILGKTELDARDVIRRPLQLIPKDD